MRNHLASILKFDRKPAAILSEFPIGQLSPVSLKKIRVVHVLDGYDKRDIAKQYIW